MYVLQSTKFMAAKHTTGHTKFCFCLKFFYFEWKWNNVVKMTKKEEKYWSEWQFLNKRWEFYVVFLNWHLKLVTFHSYQVIGRNWKWVTKDESVTKNQILHKPERKAENCHLLFFVVEQYKTQKHLHKKRKPAEIMAIKNNHDNNNDNDKQIIWLRSRKKFNRSDDLTIDVKVLIRHTSNLLQMIAGSIDYTRHSPDADDI